MKNRISNTEDIVMQNGRDPLGPRRGASREGAPGQQWVLCACPAPQQRPPGKGKVGCGSVCTELGQDQSCV